MESVFTALRSIWSNKIRSMLTVLGIVIGVASVTILVSLGQGLKNQVSELIRGFGTNLIFMVPGKIDTGNTTSLQTNPANFISAEVITTQDIVEIEGIKGVEAASPMVLVPGNVTYDGKSAIPVLSGSTSELVKAIDVLQVSEGRFIKSSSEGNVIVIGPNTKKTLFGDASALGKSVLVGEESFRVIGAFSKMESQSIFDGQFDDLSVIPFDTATRINKNQIRINRVAIKVSENSKVIEVKDQIFARVLSLHKGEEDFTLLTQDDILGLFDDFLSLATTLVSAIASISLLVGGIGIMNIMLVTVTERTKEIGLRKAVGATKLDIAIQFLVEAIFVTLLGGVIGLLISFGVSEVVKARTPLNPSITSDVIIIALGVSMVVGIIFGIWPALRAASKDPIEALRYE